MAVNITSPQSAIVDISKSTGRSLTWTAITGQTHIELCYKLKSTTSWSTMGKIAHTTNSYDLINLYNKLGASCNFGEYHYRLIVYYTQTNTIGTLTGKEYSPAFNIIFEPAKSGLLNIKGVNDEKYPVFGDIGRPDMAFKTVGGTKKAPLVDNTHALKGKVKAANGKFLAKNSANFASPGINGKGYFVQDASSQYKYTYYEQKYKSYSYVATYKYTYGTYYYYYSGYDYGTYYYSGYDYGTYYYLTSGSYDNRKYSSGTYKGSGGFKYLTNLYYGVLYKNGSNTIHGEHYGYKSGTYYYYATYYYLSSGSSGTYYYYASSSYKYYYYSRSGSYKYYYSSREGSNGYYYSTANTYGYKYTTDGYNTKYGYNNYNYQYSYYS